MNNKNNENSIRKIETNGVEQIPDHERTASPRGLLRGRREQAPSPQKTPQ